MILRYGQTIATYIEDAVALPTAREVVAAVWHGAVEATTGSDTPFGCLIVQGALSCSSESEPIREKLAALRRSDRQRLRDRFAEAVRTADLPQDIAPGILASYVVTMQHGIAVQARSGASRSELDAMVDLALAGLESTSAGETR